MRTKRCTRCQTVKPWSDFYPRTRWEDGTTRTVRPECKACSVRLHVATRRTVESYRRRHAEHQERYRQLRCSTPEGLGLERARKRDYMRRKHGVTPDRYRTGEATPPAHGGPTVDAAPFIQWLRSFNANAEQTAKIVGMNPRRVHALFNGEQARVELDTVDRALCGYGRPDLLNALYPAKAKVA